MTASHGNKNKTTETEADVQEFINSYVDNELKKADSFKLIELMKAWSGCEPKNVGTHHGWVRVLPLQVCERP